MLPLQVRHSLSIIGLKKSIIDSSLNSTDSSCGRGSLPFDTYTLHAGLYWNYFTLSTLLSKHSSSSVMGSEPTQRFFVVASSEK